MRLEFDKPPQHISVEQVWIKPKPDSTILYPMLHVCAVWNTKTSVLSLGVPITNAKHGQRLIKHLLAPGYKQVDLNNATLVKRLKSK